MQSEDSVVLTNDKIDIRLDRFLRDKTSLTQGTICRRIRHANIIVNSVPAKSHSQIIPLGAIVSIKNVSHDKNESFQTKHTSDTQKRFAPREKILEIKNAIIFENDEIAVINKPYNIATQAGGNLRFALDDIIKVIFGKEARIVHRLDKETSGIIVIAKTFSSARSLFHSFANRLVKKTYIATVNGIPKEKEGIISSKISKTTFMNTHKSKHSEDGKEAITHYKVLKVDKLKGLALLELKPHTGRMHQLRIHCSEILKTPIVGDYKYGDRTYKRTELNLCAYSISIPLKEDVTTFTLLKLPTYFLLTNEVCSED